MYCNCIFVFRRLFFQLFRSRVLKYDLPDLTAERREFNGEILLDINYYCTRPCEYYVIITFLRNIL